MSLRTLPDLVVPTLAPAIRQRIHFEPGDAILERFKPGIRQASKSDEDAVVINIFGFIGDDPFFDSVSPTVVERRLNQAKGKPVTVNVNSFGGDFFAGQAMFNLFRQHDGEVTMKVLGLAASAASVIVMAGDKIEIGAAAWLMIHNTWTIIGGDATYLEETAATMRKFDSVTADVYAARSGFPRAKIVAMMEAETFLSGEEAIDMGLADALLAADQVEEAPAEPQTAQMEIHKVFRQAGLSRSKARELIRQLKSGKPRAADDAMPSAGDAPTMSESMDDLKQAIAGFADVASKL